MWHMRGDVSERGLWGVCGRREAGSFSVGPFESAPSTHLSLSPAPSLTPSVPLISLSEPASVGLFLSLCVCLAPSTAHLRATLFSIPVSCPIPIPIALCVSGDQHLPLGLLGLFVSHDVLDECRRMSIVLILRSHTLAPQYWGQRARVACVSVHSPTCTSQQHTSIRACAVCGAD